MEIINASNPRYADAENTKIDLDVLFQEIGESVPFTATADDIEEHGRTLHAMAVAGDFGPIAPYVAPPLTERDYVKALDNHLNAAARALEYDSIHTAALRAGYPGPFHDQGVAFATWMDACYSKSTQIRQQVLDGQRAQPAIAEFLAEMPTLTLP